MNKSWWLVMALTASLAATLPVRAQDQTNGQSDTVFINGNPVIVAVEATNVSQFFPAFFPAPGLANGAVLFFEDASQTITSDEIFVLNQQFYFASDPDLQPLNQLGVPVIGVLVESGLPQDVSGAWGLPPNSVAVLSDVAIPEPNTILLAVFGLLGVLLAMRRRRTVA